jgi:hypothetical protein
VAEGLECPPRKRESLSSALQYNQRIKGNKGCVCGGGSSFYNWLHFNYFLACSSSSYEKKGLRICLQPLPETKENPVARAPDELA